MKSSFPFVIWTLLAFLAANARGDLRALDNSELTALGRMGATALETCPGWSELKELAGPEILNKTDEHVDRSVIASELIARIKKAGKIQWSLEKDEPLVEIELRSRKSEGKGGVKSTYELELRLKDCKRILKLEKSLKPVTTEP